jgi:putative transposase
VGWALETHLQASLATAALTMALAARCPTPGSLIHHSDRGVQGGFNRSSQHPLYGSLGGIRREFPPVFSSQGFFGAGC